MHLHTSMCAVVGLAFLTGAARAAALTARQDVGTTQYFGSLYCYGEGIQGLPVYYADEVALIGVQPLSDVVVATNVTFDDPEETTTLTASGNETDSLTATTLFIDTSPGANQAAGFMSTTNDSDSLTTSGFILFGNQLAWVSDAGDLEQKFWAKPTSTDGVYTLAWNVDAVVEDGAVPVNVKNVAPVTVGGDV
ncbi:hypothetical protein CLAFUW4_12072 [Fulvia fulva]|uniref:Uncharacterized protein n=1 Tax=Passalora fulva TaxID=5499 RepID=A0A9Q8PEQ5_PASFU|nr:uncharacterized protein CLAFUR5_11111 [Fulvia fulva]KAK4618210.1 hypothetical protein CLAFUR4_12077 [Fulvia fulva]KAK4618363.1 hypothetical protein CLAFUR0_12088 [Fulvia fulva]UJO21123.1 hypothetical protein CLAFUR5_11111 [Fulvia fulva]WPV17944.1 hypothetical protein CLAFUW4_12072 [Fulvia fulva]WPV32992.1 hypothetical protein CLAFUW7_12079 [Fulvia fulva]